MEQYKKTLRFRIALLAIPVLLAVAVGIYDVFFASEAMQDSFISGFKSGAMTAFGLLSVFMIIRIRKIMCDETRLRMMYNKENDERNKAIRAKAGMPVMLITSLGMFLAGIIVGYFNMVAFYTLIAAAICQLFIGAAIKLVYQRKL